MHRCIVRPRPAAKFCSAVVGKGLVDFGFGVHHKRAVLRHRLGNRFALQHQKFADLRAIDQFDIDAGVQLDGSVAGHGLPAHRHLLTLEEIKAAPGAG